MFVHETETQENEEEVLMKRLATGEPAQKYTLIEEPAYEEDAGKLVGAARISRRPKFTLMETKKKKASGNKRKDEPTKVGNAGIK